MGNGQVQRYIGGKVPRKYFSEDIWPSAREDLAKLSVDESRGYELFKIFVKIDTDMSGTLEVEECMAFFGGKRTRFTERIFDTIEMPSSGEKEGLTFVEFSLTMWSFCTLNVAGLARYIYEIYDIDMNGYIEGGEVAAIYRMMYDVDEDDTKIVTNFPLKDGKITKEHFIKYVKSKKAIISPAIEYQTRLRKYLGGLIMWEQLVGYRKRHFAVYDQKSRTLEEAFIAIVNSPDPNKKEIPLTATEIVILEKEKILQAAEEARLKLVEHERLLADAKRKAMSNQEDRAMGLAWMAVEAKKNQFAQMIFTTSNIMTRQEERNEIYNVLDKAIEITRLFWIEKYRKQDFQAFGTQADVEARISDYNKSETGLKDYERIEFMETLTVTMERMKSLNVQATEKGRADINQIKNQIAFLQKGNFNFETARKLQNKFTKNIDLVGLQERVKAAFADFVISQYKKHVEQERVTHNEEREKDFQRKEFAIATLYGSRHTRWETVLDDLTDKMVTINVDTLRMMNSNACICEMCDKTIEQNDKICFNCKAPRSEKNRNLYKPLGAL